MKNCRTDIIPDIREIKTLSSKNFDSKKYRNKNMKIFALPNKNIYEEKKISTTLSGYTPLLNENNESIFNYNFKTNGNERNIFSINKKGLKLNIDDLKNYKKINNKKNNYNKKTMKKAKNKIIIKKNISNLKDDYSSYDTFKKSKQKINTEILNNPLNYKKELVLFSNNKNKLAFKNNKKNSLLNKLMKDKKIKNQKEQNIKSKQIKKNTLSNINNNEHKFQSLKQKENYKDYYEKKILSNISLENIQKSKRMIIEEKNKSLNKLNINILKYKDKKNLNQLINKNDLNKESKSHTYNKNNELNFSDFQQKKIGDNNK